MNRVLLLAIAALGVLVLSACRDSSTITVDGSSTVYPITEAAAEEFAKATHARINVAFSGTGGGFEKLCRGDIDAADASRPIKDSERQKCADNGITDIIELQVAIDALTVMVNSDNDFVDCLTIQELHHIFRRDGARRWSDVRPEWPDQTINRYFPGVDSGTFDFFVERVITHVDEDATHTGDGTASEDDNVLALGVGADSHAIGYFGFAYYKEAGTQVRAVALDDGDGCIEPTTETAAAGEYALARPLFVYTRERTLVERPAVLDFVRFYLDNAEQYVTEVGYIPLPADLREEQEQKIARYVLAAP